MSGFLFFLFVFFSSTHALRVLIVGTNIGYSHLGFTGRVADVLVEAGHQVDFLIPLMNNEVERNGTRLARVRRLRLSTTDRIEERMYAMAAWGDAFESDMGAADWAKFDEIIAMYCKGLLSDSSLISDLREENYEVAMAEHFDSCAFALFRHLRVPSTHVLSAIPLDEFTATCTGVPVDMMIKPLMVNSRQFTPIESTYERVWNTIEYLRWRFLYFPQNTQTITSAIRRVLGPDFPSTLELCRSVDFVWLNTNEQVDQPRSISARIKSIGGIAVSAGGRLDAETSRLLGNSSEGAVLVSFGSIVDTRHMKNELRGAFLDAFSRFPEFEFVWKVTRVDDAMREALAGHPNVHAVEWMDQSGILAHEKTRAFVTHAGLNSLNEAATHGVPLIAIPFFGDQHINSAAAVRRGFAVALDRKGISAELVAAALTRVLRLPDFRLAAADVKRKIADPPITPAELLVRHVEFAARHGSLRELELPDASQPLWRQLGLDVWLVLMGVSLISSMLMVWTLTRSTSFVLTHLPQISTTKKFD